MNAPPPKAPNDDTREVAHDVSNLLTAIIGAADAVLERSGIDPEARADVAHIREGARRGAGLVQRLRGGTTDALGFISVNATIRATSRLLAHRLGANIALTIALGEPDFQVRADPSQLDRLLLNLVANARHAMADGGTVTLVTSRRMMFHAETRFPDTIPPGDFGVISVTDTGSGIPREALPRIFEPGVSSRRHAGGSGLGLASVRDIVSRCDGFVAVESVKAGGTRFEIFLPGHDAVAQPGPAAPPAATTGTVLLVDDDPIVRQIAERVLHRAGWVVLPAESAEDALEILKKARCDLVISDIAMPGMDGVALARHVQEARPDLPIILTSGYERTTTEDGFGIGNFVFLTKPYGQEDLLEAVARVAAS
jgi:two-component system cell cycle sensor histidine kinase/response regulator CckA